MADSYFLATLRALREGGVKFVVVGGLAAVLNGAPVQTYDLDIVPARDGENVARLVRVLDAIDALLTINGPLDVLGTIGRGLSYEDLLAHTEEMEIGGKLRVRVLNLAKIVELKEELGGEKDLAVLPILRRTLEEKRRGSGAVE
jgi:predicted nucleotidyltransferase